jgi:SAM-dependent methyltransferase
MQNFEDYFSRNAGVYARRRPRYPAELFAYLASISPGRDLAWDCATGNGQAALALAQFFDRVVATDASVQQLAHAFPHARVVYRQSVAEQTALGPGSADLVTVAVAVHWFDLDRFYEEVRRVLKPGGVLAVWTYYAPVTTPELDGLLERLNLEILGDYWPEQIHFLREGYRTLPFPFEEIVPPPFEIEAEWDLRQLVGFITSWSASRNYLERHGSHAVEKIWPELKKAWGPPGTRRPIRWPLYLRVGRTPRPGTSG